MEHYREAIQLGEDDDDIHIAAFASYELATILTKCPEVKLDLLFIFQVTIEIKADKI